MTFEPTFDRAPFVAELEEAKPEPTQAHKDFMANGSLMVRWAAETRMVLLLEFLREEQLFGKLNAFLKRKIR